MAEYLLILGIAILLFFGMRGWMLWYWKVDKVLESQKETNILLRSIYHELQDQKVSQQDSTGN